jgi:SET domain-containing protein
MNLTSPTKIQVRNSPIHGWGVFATSFIFKGETLEDCPIYTVQDSTDYVPLWLQNYKFNYPPYGNPVTKMVITFGYGCIYNHSNTPNAAWDIHPQNEDAFRFYALEDIYPDQEIFVYYGNESYFLDKSYTPK